METRNIQTQIDDIESRIKAAIKAGKVSEKIIKWLNKKLDTFKNDQRLSCPISLEPFSADTVPYTILTASPAGSYLTVVSSQTKNDFEKTKLKKDPCTTYEIIGYQKNDEIIKLVKAKEAELDVLEELVKEATKPENKIEFEGLIDKEEKERLEKLEKAKLEKAATALLQSSMFSQLQIQGDNKPLEIILYKAGNGEFAVKLPNEQIAEAFINYFKEDGVKHPVRFSDKPTVFFFEAYKSTGGEFTAIFPTKTMRMKFYNSIIKRYTRLVDDSEHTEVMVRTNKAGQHVIHFCDQVFYQNRGNVTVPVPQELLPVKPTATLKK
jgi:hypothetical protein